MEAAFAACVPPVDYADAKLSKAEILRGFITERLTTAAHEIFAVVERTVAGYEEEASGLRQELERQRQQMDAVLRPPLGPTDVDDQGLQYKINTALPELHGDAAAALSEHLREIIGVGTAEDLLFVEPDDLRPFLTPVQSRRLVKAFSQAVDEDVKSKSSDCLVEAGANCSPPASLDAYSPLLVHSAQSPLQPCTTETSWISGFQIPWEKMPATLSQAIAIGVLPQPEDRRKMIRIVVEAMRLHCPNPNLAACTDVARMIVSQFPTTFADKTADDEQLGCGYYSILKQLKTRVEYVNRYDFTGRVRQPRKRPDGEKNCGDRISPIKRGRSVRDRYGCLNWQPTALPEGETADSLEAKRQTMLSVYRSAGPQAVETTDVKEYMALTYIYQRQTINSWPAPSLCDIQEEWPFLFTAKGLCAHFHLLTGVKVDTCIREALQTKGRRLWNFFQSRRPNQEIEQFVLAFGSTEPSGHRFAVAVVLLAMKYFQDEDDSIFILADASSTKASVEMGMNLPASPRLIMLGNDWMSATRWMVSLEGRIFYDADQFPDFDSALAVFFGSFYVFNLEYQESASVTLEMIQRFFVRINPDVGTKCSAKVGTSRKTGRVVTRKVTSINPRVGAFFQQLTEFECRNS